MPDSLTIAVLDADPDLVRGLPADEARHARDQARAVVRTVATGADPADLGVGGDAGDLGLLVLDGLLSREVAVAGTTCGELVGPGDVLRPWDWDGEGSPVGPQVRWRALRPSRLAILDRRFALSVAGWPEVVSALLARATRRTDALSIGAAISHLTGIEARVLAVLWQLADRWGRVERAGVVVPFPLTHQLLARLVGAQRPSVTTALSRLARRGALSRGPGGAWILYAAPDGTLEPEAPEAAAWRLAGTERNGDGRPAWRVDAAAERV